LRANADGMTSSSLIQAGFIGHLVTAAGYLALAIFVVFWWQRVLAGMALAFASFATSAWAAATAYGLFSDNTIGWLGQALEIVRTCGWLALLLSLLYWMAPVIRSTWATAAIGLGLIITAANLLIGEAAITQDREIGGLAIILGHLLLALLGMALVENLFRNSPPGARWSVNYLCLGVGALFAYDFFTYSDALLFRRISADLFLARGTTNGLVLPLLAIYAVRNRKGGPQIALSRRMVLHSATLVGAGFYLIIMAVVGYYVSRFGGTWSTFLQAVFFFGAILLLILPITSGSFRSYLRVFVEKNFFKYKYDYREEWLRFIQTISAADRTEDLRNRVVEAVCNIMDSPDGGLWLQRHPTKYTLVSAWNLSRWQLSADAAFDVDSDFVRFLQKRQWIADLVDDAHATEQYQMLPTIPQWLRDTERAWLAIPLIRRELLFGVIVIGRPRVPHVLSWEDIDLLRIIGRQAASYLAEQETAEALIEARQFAEFNKRFAFVAHDIKNLVSQLSLIVSNAARHKDNATFQRDANETLRKSVEKLNLMLRQLNGQQTQADAARPIALAPLLQDIVEVRRKTHCGVTFDPNGDKIAVAVDEHRIRAIIEHLVQNAIDAVGEHGHVRVRLFSAGNTAFVEIEDDGPGMDADFVREKLFRPFVSTKGSGFGIGVYESREYATSLGGQLDVVTEPGRGTIMRISLPMAETAAARGHDYVNGA